MLNGRSREGGRTSPRRRPTSSSIQGSTYFGCIVIEVTRTDPVRVMRTTFAPDLGPVMLEVQLQDGAKFTTTTRARLRAVTRPGDVL